MSIVRGFLLPFCVLFLFSLRMEAQTFPTALACTPNARASRAFDAYDKKEWSGVSPLRPSVPFGVTTTSGSEMDNDEQVLRDTVFSGLNSTKPVVRRIKRNEDGSELSIEYETLVVARFSGAVWLVWGNMSDTRLTIQDLKTSNLVWLAVVNLEHHKAIVTQAFDGGYVGGDVETLDCR